MKSDVRVYLGGEGANELGSRACEPAYQSDTKPGVLQSLLRKVQRDGWSIAGATIWKRIRKFQAKGPTPKEERNVLGLIEAAIRAEADVVAYVRDRDEDLERAQVIAQAILKAEELFPSVRIAGGTAVPVLEAWILAILGEHQTEKLSKAGAQSRLESKGVARKDTQAMVSIVDTMVRDRIPRDAESLCQWLSRAEETLTPLCQQKRASLGDLL